MPRHCSVCNHPDQRGIAAALMSRVPLRKIQAQYGLSKSALDRHVSGHVTKALRRLAAAETEMSLPDAAAAAQPVLLEMRNLNRRALRILTDAEASEDRSTALHAIRECRRNLELIAKLTGELDPRSPGETPGQPLNITVVYAEKAAIVAPAASEGPRRLPEATERASGAANANAGHSTGSDGNVLDGEIESGAF